MKEDRIEKKKLIRETSLLLKELGIEKEFKRLKTIAKRIYKGKLFLLKDTCNEYSNKDIFQIELYNNDYDLIFVCASSDITEIIRELEDYLKC